MEIETSNAYSKAFQQTPECVLFDAFQSHWLQALGLMKDKLQNKSSIAEAILKHLDHIFRMLKHENVNSSKMGFLLKFSIDQCLFDRIVSWISIINENSQSTLVNYILVNSFKIFNELILDYQEYYLNIPSVSIPVVRLIHLYKRRPSLKYSHEISCLALNIVISVNKSDQIYQNIKNISSKLFENEFIIFDVVLSLLNDPNEASSNAQDALIIIAKMSLKYPDILAYLLKDSYFAKIVICSLCGYYSRLPRILPMEQLEIVCKYGTLFGRDQKLIPAVDMKKNVNRSLFMFVKINEFLTLLTKLSHQQLIGDLVRIFRKGFLVPVIAPSLHETSLDEVVATTAYLELIIRLVSVLADPKLLATSLQFILMGHYGRFEILQTLLNRINSNGNAGIVTLSLFRTILNLNCEDVYFHLILKHLLSISNGQICPEIKMHLRKIRDEIYLSESSKFTFESQDEGEDLIQVEGISNADFYFEASERLDSMIDSLHLPKSILYSQDYLESLQRDCIKKISHCLLACNKIWKYSYTPAIFQPTFEPTELYGPKELFTNYLHDEIPPDNLENTMTLSCAELKRSLRRKSRRYSDESLVSIDFIRGEETLKGNLSILLDKNTDLDKFIEHLSLIDIDYLEERIRPYPLPMISLPNKIFLRTLLNDNPEDYFSEFKNSLTIEKLEEKNSKPSLNLSNDLVLDILTKPQYPPIISSLKKSPYGHGLGPFLSVLFTRIFNMTQNNFYGNLVLYDIIMTLATYSYPVIHFYIFHQINPSVSETSHFKTGSLLQILKEVELKLSLALSEIPYKDDLLSEANRFLINGPSHENTLNPTIISSESEMLDAMKKKYNRSNSSQSSSSNSSSLYQRLSEFVFISTSRKSSKSFIEATAKGHEVSHQKRNVIFSALLFQEIIHSLSIAAREHGKNFSRIG